MSQALKFVPVAAAFFSGCSSDDSSSSSCTWTKETTTIELKVEGDKVTAISSLKCGTADPYTDTTKLAALFTAKTLKDKDCAAAKTALENNTLCADPVYVSLAEKVGKDDKMTAVRARFANIAATTFTLESKCTFGVDTTATDNTAEFNKNFFADTTNIFKLYGASAAANTIANAIADLKAVPNTREPCGAHTYVSKVCPAITVATTKTVTVGWLGKADTAASFKFIDLAAAYCGADSNTNAQALEILNTNYADYGVTAQTSCDNTGATGTFTSALKAAMGSDGYTGALNVCAVRYCTGTYTIGTITGLTVKLYTKGAKAVVAKVATCPTGSTPKAFGAYTAITGGDTATDNACPAAGTAFTPTKTVSGTSGTTMVQADFCTST